MVQITYVEPSGNAVPVNVTEGRSLMQGATANGVTGILAECGGSCACGTCHCYVDPARLPELPEPTDAELAMLETVAADRRPNSRLSCQIRATAALDGLILVLPDRQI
jgi:2Fe-2S ferredoxin